MSQYIEWGALANIMIVGLIFGAGLPTLFAVGVRAIEGPGARHDDGTIRGPRIALAVACLAVVLGSVVAAIIYIAAGGH